jgi:hypothetical protein
MRITISNYRCFPDDLPAAINIDPGLGAFTGTNNAGKSTILRFFYELRGLFTVLSMPTGNFTQALRGSAQTFGFTAVPEIAAVFSNTNDRALEIRLDLSPSDGAPPAPQRMTVRVPRNTNTFLLELTGPGVELDASKDIQLENDESVRQADAEPILVKPFFDACRVLSSSVYIGPFRNAINVGTQTDYFDIQVGQAFIQKWKQLKTGGQRAQNEATYRLIGDIKRIFRFDDLEINPSADDQTLQLFINGRSYQLGEVGSGLTHFIIALTAASVREPSLLLIDEPELNLHPSMQLDFLTTLGAYASHGVLFSTQSYGLARAAADRVYTVRRSGDGRSEVRALEATPRLSEFLGELGFYSFRELGFERILLVEGTSDVKTMQQLLRLYKKDHEVVLLPLGGSSLIRSDVDAELAELTRISGAITALIDSERTESNGPIAPERLAFRDACERANIACHLTDRRAIENYLPDHAVKRALGNSYRSLQPFERLAELENGWAKRDNWRIAQALTHTDVDGTDVGDFIAGL